MSEQTVHIYVGASGKPLLDRIREAVDNGDAANVSAYFKMAAQEKLDNADLIEKLRQVVREELARADLQPAQKAEIEKTATDYLNKMEQSLGGS